MAKYVALDGKITAKKGDSASILHPEVGCAVSRALAKSIFKDAYSSDGKNSRASEFTRMAIIDVIRSKKTGMAKADMENWAYELAPLIEVQTGYFLARDKTGFEAVDDKKDYVKYRIHVPPRFEVRAAAHDMAIHVARAALALALAAVPFVADAVFDIPKIAGDFAKAAFCLLAGYLWKAMDASAKTWGALSFWGQAKALFTSLKNERKAIEQLALGMEYAIENLLKSEGVLKQDGVKNRQK